MKRIKFVGLDVHAETIAVAVAEQAGEIRSLGMIPNREESVGKLVKKLGPVEELRFCYEAGPTGYALYWQLTRMGAKCEVVAPTLVPVKAGDRVKTDRRDALKLARNYRAGELTAVWVPDAEHAVSGAGHKSLGPPREQTAILRIWNDFSCWRRRHDPETPATEP
jgi:transposase